jgi:hypothetical protein
MRMGLTSGRIPSVCRGSWPQHKKTVFIRETVEADFLNAGFLVAETVMCFIATRKNPLPRRSVPRDGFYISVVSCHAGAHSHACAYSSLAPSFCTDLLT